MYEDASLILLADDQRVNIWRDDVRLLMPHVPRVDVVLSDPPYQWFTSMEDLEQQGKLADLHPAALFPVHTWMAQWLPFLLQRTAQAAWFTIDRRYLMFYRALVSPSVPMQSWPLPDYPNILLLRYALTPCGEVPEDVLALHRPGQDSPEAFWSALLQHASQPPGIVFDPFAGTGSALTAALRLGYRALGCETNLDIYLRLRTRVRACLNDLSLLHSGPTGPHQEA